jgi:hypothetical protein
MQGKVHPIWEPRAGTSPAAGLRTTMVEVANFAQPRAGRRATLAGPIGRASPSVSRPHFSSISSPARPGAVRSSRSSTKPHWAGGIGTRSELERLGDALLEPLYPVARGIRLLGLTLSSLEVAQAKHERQFSLSLPALARRRRRGAFNAKRSAVLSAERRQDLLRHALELAFLVVSGDPEQDRRRSRVDVSAYSGGSRPAIPE